MRSTDSFFVEDTRAVAPLIGFILLFGIGVIAFSGYQAVQVPQQNAETEFQHHQDVQNELIVVRNAILRAGQQNQSQVESVQLGTAYRERVLALNPPDPTGTLRTKGPYNIIIDNGTESEKIKIKTRFIEYQNGYNELNIEPIRYDNSVLYLNDPEGAESVVFEDQSLIRDDGTVAITALQNPFQQSTTGRVTLELYPTTSSPEELPDGELNVTVPTQLSATYWNESLAKTTLPEEDYSVRSATDAYPDNGDIRGLELRIDKDNITINTVGINSAPDGFTTPNSERGGDDSSSGTGDDDYIDGRQSNCVVDTDVLNSGSSGDRFSVNFDLRNSNDCGNVTISEFSIADSGDEFNNLGRRGGDGDPPSDREYEIEINPAGSGGTVGNAQAGKKNDVYEIDGSKNSLDNNAVIEPDQIATVSIGYFYDGKPQGNSPGELSYTVSDDKPSESYLTLRLYFEDGTRTDIFIKYDS
jgi:hypothetical protein